MGVSQETRVRPTNFESATRGMKQTPPILRTIPSDDDGFREHVLALAARISPQRPYDLGSRLRRLFPRVLVRERQLSGEPLTWYVYRDGAWSHAVGPAVVAGAERSADGRLARRLDHRRERRRTRAAGPARRDGAAPLHRLRGARNARGRDPAVRGGAARQRGDRHDPGQAGGRQRHRLRSARRAPGRCAWSRTCASRTR